MKKLDLRQHQCPYPVVQTRKEMLDNPELPLTVLVGDDVARDNVSRLAESMGYGVNVDATEGGYALGLRPEATPSTDGVVAPAGGPTISLVTSDTMGSGDDELGQLLMKNYLFTLAEMDVVPDKMLLVNAAVKLACAGSDAIEALDKIACMGVDIAACGLCLEFYQLEKKLKVGRTTNMLEVAESLQTAGRIIRL